MSAWTCHQSDGKAAVKIVPPCPRTPYWKGPGADSEEKQEPASDLNTAGVDSLKVLDPNRPIREADIGLSIRSPVGKLGYCSRLAASSTRLRSACFCMSIDPLKKPRSLVMSTLRRSASRSGLPSGLR